VQALTIAGSVASLLGAIISLVTLILVARLKPALKRHSRHRQLTDIIDRVLRIPETKSAMPQATCDEIRFVINTARSQEFSKWPWLDISGKRYVEDIEQELDGERRRKTLQNYLSLLRDEITIR